MFTKTTTELAPEEDQGALFAILNAPRYATTDYTKLYTDQISRADQGHSRGRRPTSRSSASAAAPSGLLHLGAQGLGRARRARRARSSRTSRARLGKVAGVQAFVFSPPIAARRRRRPADLGRHPVDPRRRSGSTRSPRRSSTKAQASGRFIVVQNSLAFDAPQVTHHRRPRPRRQPQRAGQRHRQRRSACSSAAARSPSSTATPTATTSSPRCRRSTATIPSSSAQFFVRAATGEMVPLSVGGEDRDQAPRRRPSSSSTS